MGCSEHSGAALASQPAVIAPVCQKCARAARLTDGREVYRHRQDLHDKPIWKCDDCGAYVGCHPGTVEPLGTPADAELRRARHLLHEQMLDPLWMEADRCGLYAPENDKARIGIRRAARKRVYLYLAWSLKLPLDLTHTGMFDLAMCRRAWVALRSVSYPMIREWAEVFKYERPRLHFIGFKDDRIWIARRIWGEPDFYHRRWDVRAQQEIAPNDVAIFADGSIEDAPSLHSWDDSEADIAARSKLASA